jgi:hypothetical protein
VEILLLIVGLMLAAVVLVGVGDRLRLPWPALMVVLGIVVAFVPGLPDSFDLDPDLILPLFLPPLCSPQASAPRGRSSGRGGARSPSSPSRWSR